MGITYKEALALQPGDLVTDGRRPLGRKYLLKRVVGILTIRKQIKIQVEYTDDRTGEIHRTVRSPATLCIVKRKNAKEE